MAFSPSNRVLFFFCVFLDTLIFYEWFLDSALKKTYDRFVGFFRDHI